MARKKNSRRKVQKTPCVIGVTGGISSGKSTIARMFGALGARVIHADQVAHDILREPDVRRQLSLAFGDEILNKSGAVLRRKLAEIAFSSAAGVKKLNRATHPAILRKLRENLKAAVSSGNVRIVVLDVPLLFESGLDRECDFTVFVDAPLETRRRRAEKRGWPPSELDRRELFQGKLLSKKRKADFIIDNSLSRQASRKQVSRILRLVSSARSKLTNLRGEK